MMPEKTLGFCSSSRGGWGGAFPALSGVCAVCSGNVAFALGPQVLSCILYIITCYKLDP